MTRITISFIVSVLLLTTAYSSVPKPTWFDNPMCNELFLFTDPQEYIIPMAYQNKTEQDVLSKWSAEDIADMDKSLEKCLQERHAGWRYLLSVLQNPDSTTDRTKELLRDLKKWKEENWPTISYISVAWDWDYAFLLRARPQMARKWQEIQEQELDQQAREQLLRDKPEKVRLALECERQHIIKEYGHLGEGAVRLLLTMMGLLTPEEKKAKEDARNKRIAHGLPIVRPHLPHLPEEDLVELTELYDDWVSTRDRVEHTLYMYIMGRNYPDHPDVKNKNFDIEKHFHLRSKAHDEATDAVMAGRMTLAQARKHCVYWQ